MEVLSRHPPKRRGRPKKLPGADAPVIERIDLSNPKDKLSYRNALANSGNPETLYRHHYPKLVKTLMDAGCSTFEIAENLGVSQASIYNWAAKYPDFKAALRVGSDLADNRVELSLYQKAIGYKWIEEVKSKTINDIGEEVEEVTQITKQLPPDTPAITFWLKNRRSNRWKDKHEMTMNHNVHIVTTNELHQLVHQSITDGEYTVVESD